MRRYFIIKFILIIFLFQANLWARPSLENAPKYMKVVLASTSGRTVRMNKGYYDGIREGDRGEFFFNFDQSALIGLGEAVFVNTKYSYWFFKKIVLGGIFLNGTHLVYFNIDNVRRYGKLYNNQYGKNIRSVETDYLDLDVDFE